MIEFENLTLQINKNPILNGIKGTFEKGKISVILGANGAGKSSLLGLISGIRQPNAGDIKIDGTSLNEIPPKERARKIGFLAQNGDIHWDVDVQSLVELGRLVHNDGWRNNDKDKAAVRNALVATDTLYLKDKIASKLSGGEKSRVLLARVLAGEPEWILADEPLAALDPAYQIDALNNFRKIADSGVGVIIVMHDLTHAARIADSVIIMKQGAIIAAGNQDETLKHQTMADAYGVNVYIGKSNDGKPIIVPQSRI